MMMTKTQLLLVILVVVCSSSVFGSDDEYIDEVQEYCKSKSDLMSCGKMRALKYISKTARGEPTQTIKGTVEFVTIEKPTDTNELIFPSARQRAEDSEFRKFVKFLQRQVDRFLGSRAIAISLPEQLRIVDSSEPTNEIDTIHSEARKKNKKASMIIPLIMLFKLFKVKVILAVVLFGVIFIKKALFLLLLLAPSYLQMLKICKVPHYPSHGHVEEHDFGSTGYGFPGHGHHSTGYAKEWTNSRAYSAHKPT